MSRSTFGLRPNAIPLSNRTIDADNAYDVAEQPCRDSGAAVKAALRLDQRTHLDDARYRVVLRDFGSGLVEVGWSFVPTSFAVKADRGQSEHADNNRDRAMRRARSRLRHLILAIGADHLLTMTYRENVGDFERACADLKKFVRLVKARKPNWRYIAVAERQRRGAWHWHLAVVGRQELALLRTSWRRVAGDGNIDVAQAKSSPHGGSLALVRYLGKYLAKGFDDDRALNARRFRASIGIEVPMQVLKVPPGRRGETIAFALEELQRVAGSVGHVWQSDDLSAGWACSWA
jgi:hypothetical protein